MGEKTEISWCDATFNPWWGCIKVSEGCEHCYAETFAKRTGHSIWGPAATTQRRTFGDKHWQEPLKWHAEAAKAGERRRVFCASMADVFEAHPQLHTERALLWTLIGQTPALDWLLLTKRPENIADMVPSWWRTFGSWPDNVWLGTTVENQGAAEKRIPILLSIPARVRFLSCEPLLGELDLSEWIGELNGTPQYRGAGVQGRSDGRVGDRWQWQHLESGDAQRESMGRGNGFDQSSEATGGTRQRTLSDGENDDRQNPLPRSSAPVGMAPLQWADPFGSDDQPQEWRQEGQSPVEPGVGDVFGAGNPFLARAEAWARSTRRTQFDGQTDGKPSQGDQRTEEGGAEASGDREPIRSDIPSDLENRQRPAPAISWVICGGESGPRARPMHPNWARLLRDQCQAAGIAFHFKQWGQFIPVGQTDKTWYNSGDLMFAADGATPMHAIRLKSKHDAGRQLDGREWNEFPEVQP